MRVPFERQVERHGATVLRVARGVVGPSDADDVWSETFLAALRAYPGLPDDADVRAWLMTITYRKSVDQLRARRRRPQPAAEVPETVSRPDEPGEHGERVEELYALLTDLPDRQRQALALHHLGGLPFGEVAAELGTTATAARKASSDGMAALRRLMVPNEGDRR